MNGNTKYILLLIGMVVSLIGVVWYSRVAAEDDLNDRQDRDIVEMKGQFSQIMGKLEILPRIDERLKAVEAKLNH